MSINQSPHGQSRGIEWGVNDARPDSVELANSKLIRNGGHIGKLVVELTAPFDLIVDESFKRLRGVGSISRSKSNT